MDGKSLVGRFSLDPYKKFHFCFQDCFASLKIHRIFQKILSNGGGFL
jgi:hypothetical protein